ncbi:hypothetical protein KP509_10G024100 [Ceratopteris richardii]|uniref:Uncharacterized protein n=2 Tax=Ceratopteris richardii TaxID=49495 RepID=A0A8T2TZI4_CERRI|nr:hypothetical protein KP509_10G024100 [Ceratopteris richardii]
MPFLCRSMASQTSGEAHHSECNFVSASIPHFLMHYMGETAPPDTPKNKRNRRLRTTDPKIIIANGTNFKDLVLLHTAMLCHPTSLHDPEHLASPTGPLENSCTAIGSPSSSNTEEFSESPYHYIGNKPTFHTADLRGSCAA